MVDSSASGAILHIAADEPDRRLFRPWPAVHHRRDLAWQAVPLLLLFVWSLVISIVTTDVFQLSQLLVLVPMALQAVATALLVGRSVRTTTRVVFLLVLTLRVVCCAGRFDRSWSRGGGLTATWLLARGLGWLRVGCAVSLVLVVGCLTTRVVLTDLLCPGGPLCGSRLAAISDVVVDVLFALVTVSQLQTAARTEQRVLSLLSWGSGSLVSPQQHRNALFHLVQKQQQGEGTAAAGDLIMMGGSSSSAFDLETLYGDVVLRRDGSLMEDGMLPDGSSGPKPALQQQFSSPREERPQD